MVWLAGLCMIVLTGARSGGGDFLASGFLVKKYYPFTLGSAVCGIQKIGRGGCLAHFAKQSHSQHSFHFPICIIYLTLLALMYNINYKRCYGMLCLDMVK